MTYILEWCKEKKIQLSFNESCAYQLLSYGFVASDETYAHEIKRLHGGDYLVLKDKVLTIKTYHRFERNTARLDSMSEAQIIDEIDKTFRNAVNLEWAKDDEYGYRHLADLSGGLDSRMNLWIAHEEKKRKVTIITYCRIGYLDEIIAKQISLFWQDEFIFKSLDDASFMYDIDENTALLGGLSLYSAITGGKRLLESLNLSEYGIEHTGLVGDIALGSFYRNPRDGEKRRPTGMYSERLKENLPNYIKELYANYSDYEIFLMYTNGFHGACNSQLIRRHYTEVGSPFLNVEFMQLCFDIPINLRIRHNIYKKWIITKYPEAAKFKWEKTCGLITESNSRRYFRRYTKAVIRRIRKAFFKESCRADGMNPIGFWISHNDDLRNFLDSYEKNGYLYLPSTASDQLITDMKELYKTGNASEKAMVLTVLSAARLYW